LGINIMTSTKSAKRAATTAPGVKLLITAASVAATIGGWALIGAKDNTAAQTAVVPDAATVSVSQPSTELTIKLDPLPTLVPQPTPQSQIVTASNKPAVSARPANPQPAPAAPALPALRVVTAPGSGGGGNNAPAAAATTRSSK
jgi:hypothetical protein